MFLFGIDFYTKTTDVEFDLQLAALSGPRVCLVYLNHHEKPLICIETMHKTKYMCLFPFSTNLDFTMEITYVWVFRSTKNHKQQVSKKRIRVSSFVMLVVFLSSI